MTTPMLVVDNLVKRYTLPRESLFKPAPVVDALRGVSFTVQPGRSLGIVGESGSGMSTLARQVMALEAPTKAAWSARPRPARRSRRPRLRAARRDFQMVFQDPYGSLDPRPARRPHRRRAADRPGHRDQRRRVAESLDAVGLRATDAESTRTSSAAASASASRSRAR